MPDKCAICGYEIHMEDLNRLIPTVGMAHCDPRDCLAARTRRCAEIVRKHRTATFAELAIRAELPEAFEGAKDA